MRSILLKIHLYAGLLCSSYPIIFGVSSLHFNHHFVEPGHTPNRPLKACRNRCRR